MSCKDLKVPRRSAVGVFITLLFFLSLTGCAPPIGHLNGGAAAYDELLAIPQRMTYDLGDEFKRETDLSVFVSYGGALQPIPIDVVDIGIVDADTPEEIIVINGGYMMKFPGRKIISVSYDGLSAKYSVEVKDPLGIDDDSNGNGGTALGTPPWIYER